MATGGVSYSTAGIARHTHLTVLLKSGCATILRAVIKYVVKLATPGGADATPWTLQQFLAHDRNMIKNRPNTLLRIDSKLLYPDDGSQPNIESWDMSLLCTFIQKICQPYTIAALKDDVKKIQQMGNEMTHLSDTNVSEDFYNRYKNMLYVIMDRLLNILKDDELDKCIRELKLKAEVDFAKLCEDNDETHKNLDMLPAVKDVDEGLTDNAAGDSKQQTVNIGSDPAALLFQPTSEILGKGASSVVYKGVFNKNAVAIKRIPYSDDQIDEYRKREMDILWHLSDWRHPNIIDLQGSDIRANHLYLILELCQGTLEDYVADKNSHWRDDVTPLQVTRYMAEGLKYLHENNVMHRDLKPSNVLFRLKNGKVEKVCLSDFGLSKISIQGEASISGPIGTGGYLAPEVCDEDSGSVSPESFSVFADIFPLGILFCYTYTCGEHPFGKPFERQVNIIKDQKSLANLYAINHTCGTLTEAMLNTNQNNRPTIEEACEHPALWDPDHVMAFFNMLSDKLIKRDKNTWGKIQDPHLIPGGDWVNNLPRDLQKYLSSYQLPNWKKPYYQGHESETYYLLRAIRNTNSHWRTDYPEDAKKELGESPTSHVAVWAKCCPKLLVFLHQKLPSLGLEWDNTTKTLKKITISATQPPATTPPPAGTTPQPAGTTSQSAGTTRQPASTTPQPASTTPPPASTTSKPASTTPQPASTTSKPASTTPQPASTTPPPAGTTSKPASTTPQPASTTPPPASTTPPPASTTPQPASTTPQPASTTRQPTGTTSQPASTTSQPAGTTRQPASTTPQPASTTPQPASTTRQPTGTTSQPASTMSQPAGTTSQPASTTSQPAGTTRQPASTTPQPASTTPQPASTTPQPASTTPQPASTTPQPASTTRQPTGTTSQPASTTSQPAGTTRQPASTTPQPASTTSQPAGTTSQSAGTTPQPTDTTPQPTGTTPQPAGTTSQPAGTTPQPADTTSQPAGTTSQSAGTTPQPAGTTSQPAGTTSQPAGTTSQPAGTTSQPAGTTSQSAGTTPQPAGTTSQPAGTTPQPAGTTSQSAGTTPQPAGTTSQPAGTTSQPASTTSQSAGTTSQLAGTTSQPASTTS